jgi:hypothetical protein
MCEKPDPWARGMLITIARDLELIKARLGIITDAEGDTRYVPGSLLPRENHPEPEI